MNIALLGYGKMGKTIETIALQRGHHIVFIAHSKNSNEISQNIKKADVAIEFTNPHAVMQNIEHCFAANVPVVVGSTGWNNHIEKTKEKFEKHGRTLLYASNFSVGVNIFFAINKKLAELMNQQEAYNVKIDEIHHTQKLDKPSGTAITIAEDIIAKINRKKQWVLDSNETNDAVNIFSHRQDNVPGTHIVTYQSDIDTLEIKHTAHNRQGFALGAVIAAEWLKDKKGVFTMNDVLNI
jgi:4-hydroxy-tetrahydrodipicolinate reductase